MLMFYFSSTHSINIVDVRIIMHELKLLHQHVFDMQKVSLFYVCWFLCVVVLHYFTSECKNKMRCTTLRARLWWTWICAESPAQAIVQGKKTERFSTCPPFDWIFVAKIQMRRIWYIKKHKHLKRVSIQIDTNSRDSHTNIQICIYFFHRISLSFSLSLSRSIICVAKTKIHCRCFSSGNTNNRRDVAHSRSPMMYYVIIIMCGVVAYTKLYRFQCTHKIRMFIIWNRKFNWSIFNAVFIIFNQPVQFTVDIFWLYAIGMDLVGLESKYCSFTVFRFHLRVCVF